MSEKLIREKKVILVTGGASGIGQAIVLEAARKGMYPVILDKDVVACKKLSNLLEEQKYAHVFQVVDLTCPKSCAQAIENILSLVGHIDILVNNAGVNDAVGLSATPQQFLQSLQLNLVPAFTMTAACVPQMKTRKGCAIVNILSKVYVTGQGGTSGYAASKGGLASLTREWAVDLLPYGIRVNAVVPAEVMTTGYERWLSLFPEEERKAKLERITSSVPLGKRMTTPTEIAKTVLFLASDDASHTTGQILFVDGGYVHADRVISLPSKL